VLTVEGKFDEAIAKYRKATELSPRNATFYADWGAALKEQGKDNEASEKFKMANELSASH